MKITILGAGLSGISSSYHLGHENCVVFEKNKYPGGHIHSYEKNGFTWDEGPHVSFTKHSYVRELFERSANGDFRDFPVSVTNFFQGSWIPHPAQSNLWAIPQPLRQDCLDDFLKTRDLDSNNGPQNYQEWLERTFGAVFANTFPRAYTRKYWTTDPENLTVDWVGNRVFYPEVDDVKRGFLAPLEEQTHYIKTIRYPERGGYFSFAKKMYEGADIRLSKTVSKISLSEKKIVFSDGTTHTYQKLINTLPLPLFVGMCEEATPSIHEAAKSLSCSSLLLVNVGANHPTMREDNWLYVYDEDMYSTRINFTELLSPNNAPNGKTGIQVEVYFSKYRQKKQSDSEIAARVCQELVEMGLVKDRESITSFHTKWVPWANVIFDDARRKDQDAIFDFLTHYGLVREEDDLEPMTNWETKQEVPLGELNLAGRFGQWKYFWTDDCVLRGKIFKA